MYIDKLIKKQLVTLIISVIILLFIFIGVSFASFFSIDDGEENTITIGDLEIMFCEDSDCKDGYDNLGQVIGMKNVDGVNIPKSIYPFEITNNAVLQQPYIFNIKNTGTLISTISAKIIEDVDFMPIGDYSSYDSLTNLYSNNLKVGIRDCSDGLVAPRGDVDSNGKLDDNDSEEIMNCSNINICDLNFDNTISSLDATVIQSMLGGGINNYDPFFKNLNIYNFYELESGKIITNEKISSGEDKTYCLWIWLDENTPNNVQNSYFVANLDFDVEYFPEVEG